MTNKSNQVFYWFLGISFVLAGILAVQLFLTPTLRGWDSYYYAIQIDSWFKTGRIQHPDGNLVFLLTTPFKWLGLGAANALRAWTATSLFLFLLSFSWILRQMKSTSGAWLAFIWAMLSPMIMYFVICFPKMFAFLICFNGVFYYTIKKPFNWMGWCLWACGAMLLHRMALPYVFITAVWLCVNSIHNNRAQRKVVLGGIMAAMLFFIALQQTHIFSFSWLDFSRITAGKMLPGAFSLFFTYAYPPAKRLELLCTFIWLVGCIWHYRHNFRKISLPILWCGMSFLPAFAYSGLGIGERFGLLLPYFSMLSFIWLTYDEKGNPLPLPDISKHCRIIFLVLLGIVISVGRLSYGFTKMDISTYRYYSKWLCHIKDVDVPMLITPKGFNYFYKFLTGRESFSFAPEDHWPKDKVYRLVVGVTAEQFEPILSKECRKHLFAANKPECGNLHWRKISVLREDCYEQAREYLLLHHNPDIDFMLKQDVLNPFEKRPAFLYRKHARDNTEETYSALPPNSHIK